MLEAIQLVQEISGRTLEYTISPESRAGDHIWWISDVSRFQQDFPEWSYAYDLRDIIEEIVDAMRERSEHAAKVV
jgi:CDP-paratose 2-epimerase